MDTVLFGSYTLGGLLITLVIGAICGFLAGQIMKGAGMGLLTNIVVGIVGALIFGAIFGSLGLVSIPFVNEIIGGTIGSVILLFVLGLVKKTAV